MYVSIVGYSAPFSGGELTRNLIQNGPRRSLPDFARPEKIVGEVYGSAEVCTGSEGYRNSLNENALTLRSAFYDFHVLRIENLLIARVIRRWDLSDWTPVFLHYQGHNSFRPPCQVHRQSEDSDGTIVSRALEQDGITLLM